VRFVLTTLLATTTVFACAGDDHDDDASALFEQAYQDKDDSKADEGCSGVRVPDQGDFGRRVILTFDDGPNPATTPRVMEILRRHHAKATFFINGSRLDAPGAKEIAAQIAADPLFVLANHSHHHKNLAQVSATELASQIDRTTDGIVAAGEMPRYFRFPYGSANCAATAAVRERGYIVSGWHVDSADWCFAAGGGHCAESTFRYVPDEYRSDMPGFVMSQVRARRGGIVLFHDIHQSTADALDGLLTTLVAEGYAFVGIDDATVLPRLNGVGSRWIGDPCTEDAQCNYDGGFCAGGFCSKACTRTCPDRTGTPVTRCVEAPAPDDETTTIQACAVTCGEGNACRPGTTCQELPRPDGQSATSVCWP
jgi:peptidoglycan/xylan/chitin deacetylase (PgdA/CDA1 family)